MAAALLLVNTWFWVIAVAVVGVTDTFACYKVVVIDLPLATLLTKIFFWELSPVKVYSKKEAEPSLISKWDVPVVSS